ncbi:MAG: hypothetical protein RSD74_02160 [Angelakisella sp.]
MAEKIKGITIEIGGDVTGLDKALKDVNKESSSLQDELKKVDRLLKFDPTNTQLLEQKQALLAKSVTNTAGKLETLKLAEKEAQEQFKQGKISEEQYRALQREVVSTEQALEKMTTQIDKSQSSMSKFLETSGKVGEKLTSAGKAMAPISAAAGAAAAGLATAAVSAGAAADDINTLAKQTGLSVEQIQKFQYASDIIDVSIETLTGSMQKLTKNMDGAKNGSKNTQAAFQELGVSFKNNITGELRNNQDVFNEAIEALGKISNETKRDALAMQIFGKSAQDLNPLILGGADALKTLGDEAAAAGLILSQDALDAANEFNDEIDSIKATAKGTFAAIGTELAAELLPIMQEAMEMLKGVLKVIREMDGDTLRLIVTILSIVAAIAPLLILIGKIATGITALSSALTLLAANPMVLIVAGVVAIIAAIAMIEKKTQIFSKTFTTIWDGVKTTVKTVSDFVVSIFTEKIPNALEKLQNFFVRMFENIARIIKAPFNLIISAVNAVISTVNKAISWMNDLKLPSFLGGGSLGINIPTLGDIPMLANGGILSSGSAIVGERAPELLTMINGKAMVQPLPATRQSGAPGSSNGNTYIDTYNITVDASNLQEVDMLMKMFNGERMNTRKGWTG